MENHNLKKIAETYKSDKIEHGYIEIYENSFRKFQCNHVLFCRICKSQQFFLNCDFPLLILYFSNAESFFLSFGDKFENHSFSFPDSGNTAPYSIICDGGKSMM